MTTKLFVDTNVLVYYLEAGGADGKGTRAADVVDVLVAAGVAVISAQVVGEFLSASRKSAQTEHARAYASGLARTFCDWMSVHPLTDNVVHEALRARERYGLDYFDAQIWACARLSGCTAIITEDTHGPEIEGVRYVDPLAEDFDLAALLAG